MAAPIASTYSTVLGMALTASVRVTGKVYFMIDVFLGEIAAFCHASKGELCGVCRDGKGVSALLNKCTTCSDASGLLILLLSETDHDIQLIVHSLFLYRSCLGCWSVCFSFGGYETISNMALSLSILPTGVCINKHIV